LPGDGTEWLFTSSNKCDASREGPQQFLLVEGNLGIPQKTLYKAYLEATQIFNLSLKDLRMRRFTGETASNSENTKGLAHSTSVLILVNPGHQSAWNSRKYLVQCQSLNPDEELRFTAALLTVRECAKHSLLWHHRRWLLRRVCTRSLHAAEVPLHTHGYAMDDEDSLRGYDLAPSRLRDEFTACTAAANTYERNYFAWTHRTRCLDALVATLHTIQSDRKSLLELLSEEMSSVALWIERHVSDYTAMQYRCRLQLLTYSLDISSSSYTFPSVYSHARSLLVAYPDHESLWYYLRGALLADKDLPMTNASERGLVGLCHALQEKMGSNPVLDASASPAGMSSWRHADRFLAWLSRQE
jgi:protein prenyltransferase alpha subunit repeat containing protein 1